MSRRDLCGQIPLGDAQRLIVDLLLVTITKQNCNSTASAANEKSHLASGTSKMGLQAESR
jgi:hypothetical protein